MMMKNFSEYSNSFSITYDPGLLDFGFEKSVYIIFEGTKPLLTPGGNTFSHPSESLIRMILTDLQLQDRSVSKECMSPVLFSYLKDSLQSEDDPINSNWSELIENDPFVRIKTIGNTGIRPLTPEEPLFAFSFNTLSGISWTINHLISRLIGEISISEDNDTSLFPEIIKLNYTQTSSAQKAAIQALSSKHKAGIVLPLLVVTGEISPSEYCKCLIALRIQNPESFSSVLSETSVIQEFHEIFTIRQRQEKQSAEMIQEGEGDSIEYKSTLRWDIRAGKTNPVIERSCLKTISAFLNSAGGHLLIGVRDDGSIEGIETDKFPNEDKFLLHLWTLIRNCLGRDFTPYIRTRLEKIDDKTICIVSCTPSNRPVFLRQPGFDEEMYIRVGPSSNAMDISEALRYIGDRFRL
jgi:hypothetical protein